MKKNQFWHWFIQSVCGLIFTGGGLCMAIDAGFTRMRGEDWIGYGTLALIFFQGGLCLLIGASEFRIRNFRRRQS